MEVEIQNQNKQLNVQVAVRVRPLNPREIGQNDHICLQTTPNQVTLIQNSRLFTYDNVFNQDSNQEDIFQICVKGLVTRCFEGYNSTLLAYGQTGSGKTYTMGTSGQQMYQDDVGMIPKVIDLIFEEVDKRKQEQDILISCSYLELYNEQIIDLFNESSIKDKCQPIIREEKDHTISILNLTNVVVNNPKEMMHELNRGAALRTTAETKMNDTSSRSHAIFTIYFQINPKDEEEEGSLSAKFHFVDLAGSERLKKTQAIGKVMEEGININQSLLVLGNVIKTLSDKRRNNQVHIPYRESKLTRILQDSLGGNANTYMIACVSPAESNYEETLNTLKYASRAREIQNKPTQNRDPHTAQILALKQQIQDLNVQLEQLKQLLNENHISYDVVETTNVVSNCTEHNEIIKKLKSQVVELDKQGQSYRNQLNQFQQLQKAMADCEYERYKTVKQKEAVIRQLQEAKKLLQKYNIPFYPTEEQGLYDGFYNEIQGLKSQITDRDSKIVSQQSEINTLIKEAQRDQRILCQKQKEILKLQKKVELYQLEDQEDMQQSELEEEFGYNNDHEIQEADQQIEDYESNVYEITQRTIELKKQLADDMKQEYLTQISILESQKAQLQKQISNKQDSAQINLLKSKLSDYETKITDMRLKEQQQKQLQKKLEDQENQVRDLKSNIEKIKKQKVDLIKKMKAENEKFIKEKDEKHKELILAKKSKIQQDALVSKLKNENIKKDLLIKRKEDELLKQKNEKIISKQHNYSKQAPKLLQFQTFETQIDNLFTDLVEGLQSEIQYTKELEKLQEEQTELQLIERKLCQLQIKKEQLLYDLNTNNNANCSSEILNQIEIELSGITIERETLNETIDYQIHKIESLSKQSQKANEYYQAFLTNSYFKELPNWCTRSFKYIIDSWVKDNVELLQMSQQVTELQLLNMELQKDSSKSESPIVKKKIVKNIQPNEVQDLRKQLNEFKKKFQVSSNENKSIHIELEYYKKFYGEHINKVQKDKGIGLVKAESMEGIQHSQSYHVARDSYKQEKSKAKELQLNFLQHSRTTSSIFSGTKIIKPKSAEQSQQQWISDQMNLSQEMYESPIDLKYELVKSIHAHESPILQVYSWENLLSTSAFKQVKIWDIETQKLVSQLDQNTYVRAVCHWPERNSFAISHGNQVTLYDQNTLMGIGVFKSTIDEIRVLTTHNGMLVAGGKGMQQNSLNVWDFRNNSLLYEFEKGMDILSICQSDTSQEIFWGTFNHNVKKMQLNLQKAGPISQMVPPHYDKVTAIGLLDSWVVSCSFGKGMRMWNQFSGQQGQANSDIHKDSINTMAVDQNLKILYTGSKDGQIKAIRISENKFNQLHDLTASAQSINSVSVLSTNSYLVSGGSDKMVKIWKPNKYSFEVLRQYAQTVGDFQIEEESQGQ